MVVLYYENDSGSEDEAKENIKIATLLNYSNPKKVIENAKKYLGNDIKVYVSNRKSKKYMVKNQYDKWVHFGEIGYEDFTKHNNSEKRNNYLARSSNIKGNWKNNIFSANNLARVILWDAPF
jgi:hypothetical protein